MEEIKEVMNNEEIENIIKEKVTKVIKDLDAQVVFTPKGYGIMFIGGVVGAAAFDGVKRLVRFGAKKASKKKETGKKEENIDEEVQKFDYPEEETEE